MVPLLVSIEASIMESERPSAASVAVVLRESVPTSRTLTMLATFEVS